MGMNPQTIVMLLVVTLLIIGISVALVFTFTDEGKRLFYPIDSVGSAAGIENTISSMPTGNVIYAQLSKLLHEQGTDSS